MDSRNHPHWPGAFPLNTDAETFLTWLEQHVRAIPRVWGSWQVDSIEGGKLATCGYFTGRNVNQHGQEVAPERLHNLCPWDDSVNAERHVLGFKVFPLAFGRVQVHAGYVGDGETQGYFGQILNEVRDAYPESRDVIDKYMGEVPQQDPLGAAKCTGANAEEAAISCMPEGRDKEWVRLWRRGLTAPEIALKFRPIEPKTVHNTICNLRKAHGEFAVPYRRGKSKKE